MRLLLFMILYFNYLKNFGLFENERLYLFFILFYLCIIYLENLWYIDINIFLIYLIIFNIIFKLVRWDLRFLLINFYCKCIMFIFSVKEENILEIIFFMYLCLNLLFVGLKYCD